AAKTSDEKDAIIVKGISIFALGVGSTFQLMAGVSPASVFTIVAMSPWFSVSRLVIGTLNLFTTMAMSYFKQDTVAWSLRMG
ncbi:hypothetical protein RA276_30630, partial [Pseudomonas syringae pv. tagetis]